MVKMRKVLLILPLIWISLTSCSSMSGNVVPQSGPNMEKVYDDMNNHKNNQNLKEIKKENKQNKENADLEINPEEDEQEAIQDFRQNYFQNSHEKNEINNTDKINKENIKNEINGFRKLPNPELTLYIYPHLAGSDELPVPGYFTKFNVYTRDYYALPYES